MRPRNEIKDDLSEALLTIKDLDTNDADRLVGAVLVTQASMVELLMDIRDLLNDIRHNTTGSLFKRGG